MRRDDLKREFEELVGEGVGRERASGLYQVAQEA